MHLFRTSTLPLSQTRLYDALNLAILTQNPKIHHHSSLNIRCICLCVTISSYMSSPSSLELVSDLSYCSAHNTSSSVSSKSLLIFLNDLVMMTHCVMIGNDDGFFRLPAAVCHCHNAVWSSSHVPTLVIINTLFVVIFSLCCGFYIVILCLASFTVSFNYICSHILIVMTSFCDDITN